MRGKYGLFLERRTHGYQSDSAANGDDYHRRKPGPVNKLNW